MAKKYVLTGAVAAFLAAASIAQAPILNINPPKPSICEVKNRNLVRSVLVEPIREDMEQREEALNLAAREIHLSQIDEIYGHIINIYHKVNVPKHITKKFVRAQIWAESEDYPKAVGKAGERGLMQIMPDTWKGLEPKLNFKKNAFNPERNIYAGVKHLVSLDRELKWRNSRWEELNEEEKRKLIAAAYNCGTGRLMKSGYNIDNVPERTKWYIKKIERLMSQKYEEY